MASMNLQNQDNQQEREQYAAHQTRRIIIIGDDGEGIVHAPAAPAPARRAGLAAYRAHRRVDGGDDVAHSPTRTRTRTRGRRRRRRRGWVRRRGRGRMR